MQKVNKFYNRQIVPKSPRTRLFAIYSVMWRFLIMIERILKIKNKEGFLTGICNNILLGKTPQIDSEIFIGCGEIPFFWFDFHYLGLERKFTFTYYLCGSMFLEEHYCTGIEKPESYTKPSEIVYNPLLIYGHLSKYDFLEINYSFFLSKKYKQSEDESKIKK